MDRTSCYFTIALILFMFNTVISGQQTEPCGRDAFVFKYPLENLPVGAVAAHVQIPGSDDEVDLSQIGTDPNFEFDPASRNITVLQDLELATERSTEILIKCEMRTDRSKTSELTYIMHIQDLNNHSPVFEGVPYSTEVTELLLPGYVIFDGVKATDGDPSNEYITFEIQPGPFSDHFSFTAPAKGSVQLDKMVDFEQVQLINLTIIAKDHHPDRDGIDHVTFNDSTQLVIHIQDGDDQNPEFYQKTYSGRVSENATVGTVVSFNPEVSAYDPDVNVNSVITYSIPEDTHNDDWEFFSIHPTSGQITVKKASLVRGSIHTFLVQATKMSNENHFAQALVHVTVQAINENAPYFLESEYKVNNLMENSPIGSSVITVKALDDDIMSASCNNSDKGSKLVYSLAGVDDFVIDDCTGEITTAAVLSYEDQSTYNIRVIVSDGTYSDEAVVHVNLFNVNNHNPQFQQSLYTFEGKREQGFILGSVKAEDRDVDSEISYWLASHNSKFDIDQTYGNLTISAEEVEQLMNEYEVVVVAEDEGKRSDIVKVMVIFDPIAPIEPTIGQVVEEGGESNIVIVVILGVLIGVLLVVIAILGFCIYRNGDKNSSSKSDGCERSTSFQNSIDFNQRVTRSWTDPHKDVVKPSNQQRLNFYNSVAMADDPTTTAENPFQQSHDSSMSDLPPPPPPHVQDFGSGLYAYHSVSDVEYPTDDKGNVIIASPVLYARPVKTVHLEGATNTYSSDNSSALDRMSPTLKDLSVEGLHHIPPPPPLAANQNRFDNVHHLPPANQNTFDSDLEVHGKYREHGVPMNVTDNSPRSSYSDENYNQDMTSFKVGSTTQLVGTPSKSKSRSGSSILYRGSTNLSKGSGSLNLHKGNGNISFVDTVDVSPPNSLYSSMTSQRSGLDPALGQEEDGRPGITVYY